MFYSLCFLLALASYGFSGVESFASEYEDAGSYGGRGMSLMNVNGRAAKEAPIEVVNEGMDKLVAAGEALVEGSTPVDKRSGMFLAAAKPELAADIEQKLKDARVFADKMKKEFGKERRNN